MMMAGWRSAVWAARVAAILAGGFALAGCESIREATGAAKLPPDEFTVLTKAPLIIPPDYNLRPPQPGIASRNEVDPDDQARAALFSQDAAAQAAALGTNYSDGEKLLLARTGALAVDPDIRREISSDVGHEDQGPAFAQKVLFEGTGAPPPPTPTAAAAPPAAPTTTASTVASPRPQPNAEKVLYEGTGAPPPPLTPAAVVPAATPAPAPSADATPRAQPDTAAVLYEGTGAPPPPLPQRNTTNTTQPAQ
jgi:hypothetical protein